MSRSNGGSSPGRPTPTCLGKEINIYGRTIDALAQVRAQRRLRVAVFSRDSQWAERLAPQILTAQVFHVNGQAKFPVPDVVISEEHSGPLARAAAVVADLRDGHQVSEVAEIETIRQAAQHVFNQPFKYGLNGRFR